VRAVWYDRQGAAAEVLQAADQPAPEPRTARAAGPGHPVRGEPGGHQEAPRLARLVDAVSASDPA